MFGIEGSCMTDQFFAAAAKIEGLHRSVTGREPAPIDVQERQLAEERARGWPGDLPAPAPLRKWKWLCAADLEGLPIPEREWLVQDLIPARNVTLLYGDGGTGKSLLALQLAVAVALGRPWLG
ncbi:MAG TPA: AAA family ATPase, partial [Gammaproteobacteria bacterium]